MNAFTGGRGERCPPAPALLGATTPGTGAARPEPALRVRNGRNLDRGSLVLPPGGF
ncbi:hypothetical protein ACFXKW_04530 [Streptomyces sp. NPDC059193]|uniref:hypothetical protein n=1 Tax=Streptomyces sp. NPDC059193 TaxID=3346763 RepID=UPI0036BB5B31